jgi:hypothetical protein
MRTSPRFSKRWSDFLIAATLPPHTASLFSSSRVLTSRINHAKALEHPDQ